MFGSADGPKLCGACGYTNSKRVSICALSLPSTASFSMIPILISYPSLPPMRNTWPVFAWSTSVPPPTNPNAIGKPTNPNAIGNRNSSLGELLRAYSDCERSMFETKYFQHFEISVTENGKNVVMSEDPRNSYRKNNKIYPTVPSEEESLFQQPFDKLLDI